jgi:hypothetical protein
MVMRMPLLCHPHTPCGALTGIDVEVGRSATRVGARRIGLRFVAYGNLRALKVPPYRKQRRERKDELWRHTCFEAFVRAGESSVYREFNLAPSGDWACYRFLDYRLGMMAEPHVEEPGIDTYVRSAPFDAEDRKWRIKAGIDTLERFETPFYMLGATLDLSRMLLPMNEPWHLGLSAVIEERNGTRSYWALAHPAGPPDFHHPDCFAVKLAAARPA